MTEIVKNAERQSVTFQHQDQVPKHPLGTKNSLTNFTQATAYPASGTGLGSGFSLPILAWMLLVAGARVGPFLVERGAPAAFPAEGGAGIQEGFDAEFWEFHSLMMRGGWCVAVSMQWVLVVVVVVVED
ncbi:hypothetical protein K432DRAFT_388930 [Lepidopterella palustris CBS 459.81]|uniref:Uncharacterized protein n=1 Tax=Lepidopterella palustris CBS 459.81 TaxID=1314670 RepID=A0A8E2EJF6_9PEZI|nr:hypothetical protein K432DRAFT_388930 [Lepidopterella palustris CBS 459.81]